VLSRSRSARAGPGRRSRLDRGVLDVTPVGPAQVVVAGGKAEPLEDESVDPGDRALIRLQAVAGKDFEGKVTRTSWTLDAGNRTLRTEIDVPSPKGTLRPGLYAYATLVVEEHAGALTVPVSALVRQDSQTYCVAVADGRAVRKPVTVGLNDGTKVEILSCLLGSETIVKAYASSLADGQSVAIVVPEPAKAKS
jgi:multidrug efflux pump subunit AcrA (membrane-fusion protein)